MTVLRWEEPPPHANLKRRTPSKYDPLAEELRAHPMQWAVVAEGMTAGSGGNLSHRIRTGQGPFAPPKSFEARMVGAAGCIDAVVYARYVGGEVPSVDA